MLSPHGLMDILYAGRFRSTQEGSTRNFVVVKFPDRRRKSNLALMYQSSGRASTRQGAPTTKGLWVPFHGVAGPPMWIVKDIKGKKQPPRSFYGRVAKALSQNLDLDFSDTEEFILNTMENGARMNATIRRYAPGELGIDPRQSYYWYQPFLCGEAPKGKADTTKTLIVSGGTYSDGNS